jgi:hypothetical protein
MRRHCSTPKRREGVETPAELPRRLYGSGQWTFPRLSASWSSHFQPRGSRALIRASLSQVTRAQLRGLLGKQSTPDHWGRSEPPEPKLGFSVARCRGSFILAESRASVILLANPGRRETRCLKSRKSAPRPDSVYWRPLHMWACRTSQPAAAIRWEPWSIYKKCAFLGCTNRNCDLSTMTP